MQICPRSQYARAAERSEAASSDLRVSLVWRLMNDVRTSVLESNDSAQINGFVECVKTFESSVV